MEEENKTTTIEVLERMEKATKTYIEELHWICANYLETKATEPDEKEYAFEHEKINMQMIKEEQWDNLRQTNYPNYDIPACTWRFDKCDLKYLSFLIDHTKREKLRCIDKIKSDFERDSSFIIKGKKEKHL